VWLTQVTGYARTMAQKIRDLMTKTITSVDHTATLTEAARLMQQEDIGNVLIVDGDTVCGILTDRDIVVRAIAQDRDPTSTTVADICSHDLVTLDPEASVEEAKKLMADRAVRRLPVVENGKPVGIISLGDVAIEANGERALEEISAAPGNN
jgi:CBS domain-containing protein